MGEAVSISSGESEAQFGRELSAREILDHISDGFACLDAELRHTYVNETGSRLVGKTPADLVGKRIGEVYPGVTETPVYKAVRAVQAGEPVVEIDEYFEPLERWYRVRIYPGPDGGVTIFFQDSTEDRLNERRLALALASGKIGVWEHDLETDKTRCDDRLAGMFGLPSGAEMSPAAWEKIVHPDDWQALQRAIGEAVVENREFEHEFRILVDGKVKWMHSMSSVMGVQEGRRLNTIGVNVDITARKETESRLRELAEDLERRVAERTEEFAFITDNVPGFYSYVDSELRYQFVNRKYEESFGFPREHFIGRPVREVMGEDNWALIRDKLIAGLAGGEQSFEVVLKAAMGRTWASRSTVVPRRNGANEVIGVFVLSIDITEERRLQQELLEAGEREKHHIGRDLHDTVCQELTGIELLCKALERQLRSEGSAAADSAASLVGRINSAADKAGKLAQGLAPLVLEDRSLRETIAELLRDLAGLYPAVRLTSDLRIRTRSLGPAIQTQLYYIAREAVFNALKHGRPGRVEVELRGDADLIELSVTDDGSGDPERLRAVANGGLGLRFMAYRARVIGARLTIEAGPGGKGIRILCKVSATA